MFPSSILYNLNDYIHIWSLTLILKSSICILHCLQAHLSHAITMSQLIYQKKKKITFEATQLHTLKVFYSI